MSPECGVCTQLDCVERVLLPRALAAVFHMLVLMTANEQGQETDADHVVIDFKEAYWQMPISPSKRRFVVVILRGCHNVMMRATRGSRRGPLLWNSTATHDLQLRTSCVQRRLASPQQVCGRPDLCFTRFESGKAQFNLQSNLGVAGTRLATRLGGLDQLPSFRPNRQCGDDQRSRGRSTQLVNSRSAEPCDETGVAFLLGPRAEQRTSQRCCKVVCSYALEAGFGANLAWC